MHYTRGNSYIFVNRVEIYEFKAQDSEINKDPLSLGNFSKDFPLDNMLDKTGLYGYAYDFSTAYVVAVDISDILKCLMIKFC